MAEENSVADEEIRYSRQQPGWHVFVMSVLTLGVYNFYWFFRNLNLLREEDIQPDSESKIFCQNHPYFSTLLFMIPVVNMIIAMQMFVRVGELIPDRNSLWHQQNLLFAFLLAAAFGALMLLGLLPEPYHLFYLSSALPLSLVQHSLNQHWRTVEKDKLIMRSAFTPLELVLIFFGAGFLGLCAVGPSLIPH